MVSRVKWLVLLFFPLVILGEKNAEIIILCDTPPEPQMTVLQNFLITKDFNCDQWSQVEYTENYLDDFPGAIIVYIHKPLLPQVENALIKYCNQGGRLIALHHAIASAKLENKKWLPFAGIRLNKEQTSPFPWTVYSNGSMEIVKLLDHYITNNNVNWSNSTNYMSSDQPSAAALFPSFTIQETELLANQMFTDGRQKTVLLGYTFTDSETGAIITADRGGWFLGKGKGYFFYFVAGHNPSDFENQNTSQMILNCITWEWD